MLDDTIHALCTAPGRGERAVIRVSGADAFSVCDAICSEPPARERGLHRIQVELLGQRLEAAALMLPGPRSYTGEDTVELQVPGAPLLVERLGESLERAGARAALPGEFTRRAVEHHRLGLEEATAVHALIMAGDDRSRRVALETLRGGLHDTLESIRRRLLDARALCEAGLDFDEGDTGAVERSTFAEPLRQALESIERVASDRPRVRSGGALLLLGEANAGKSTLCNTLWERHHPGRSDRPVLATDVAGTTRDTVAVEWADGAPVLLDTPGDLGSVLDETDADALARRERAEARAVGALWILRPTEAADVRPPQTPLPLEAVVLTHAEDGASSRALERLRGQLPAGLPVFEVGRGGLGYDAFEAFLRSRFAAGGAAVWPGLDGVLEQARERIRSAVDLCAAGVEPELIAEEIAFALASLEQIDGESSPEDLLDRVFGAFCLGK